MRVFPPLFLIFAATLLSFAKEQEQPNFIFILTDDQGYGDLSLHRHPLLKTPHIDQLGKESVRLDNFYVSPSCSPTRAALLTGQHEFKVGVTHTIPPRQRLNLSATLLPELLKTAGYSTGFVGKWHLGNGSEYKPESRGFDWYSSTQKGPLEHFDPVIRRNKKKWKASGFREDIFFDEAMHYIEEHRDSPFFCYLSTYSPHTPLGAPEKFIKPFRGKVSDEVATYLGMIANIDYNVGRLMNFLKAKKLDENTVIIFMNDNGVTKGLEAHNAGMRGSKCSIWEGGSRAISFWRWKKNWKPQIKQNLTAHLDVLPTLCDLAGVSIPDSLKEKLDGFSLRPLLESTKPLSWNDERILFQHVARWPGGLAAEHKYATCAARQGHLLLLRSHHCGSPKCKEREVSICSILRKVEIGMTKTHYTMGNASYHWGLSAPNRWSLFNTKDDPACLIDLFHEEPEKVQELSTAYDQWWENTYPIMIQQGGDLQESETE